MQLRRRLERHNRQPPTELGSQTATSPDSDQPPAVKIRGLEKSYAGVPAVAGVDLTISHGEIFALLGPNGAGKTTTVEIMEGYRTRDGGEVTVLGYDPGHERSRLKGHIGIVLQSTAVEQYLTVAETLTMYAQMFPQPRPVDEVIELVGLADKQDARVIQLSGGLQRRLDMAIALTGDPQLLFLDEPTTGFDPAARHETWDVIKDLAALGKTVFLTTHYMDEAQYLADRVAVIAEGRIVAEGPPSTLGHRDRSTVRVRYRLPPGTTPPPGLGAPPGPDGFVEIAVEDAISDVHRLLHWAVEEGVELEGFEVRRPSLEDVYLSLTDHRFGEEHDLDANRGSS